MDVEQRARELLAAEFSHAGREQFERGVVYVVTTASALNAIIAALTPPEGWVAQHARDSKELRKLCESRDFYKHRCEALQAVQSNMRDPERKTVCDILANGSTGECAAAGVDLLAGGAVNLLGQQHPGVVAAQVLDVVPATALGANEAGAVGIGGQGDQSVGIELAEVAPEHEVGVPAGSDSGMTASLAQPEGYVLVPVDLTQEMLDAGWYAEELTADVPAVWAALLSARPEVKP